MSETNAVVIARPRPATQYSRDGRVQPRSRGVLDRPVKPGDDSFDCGGRLSQESAASPLFGDHVVAGVAAENPHGGAADDGLKIAEMRHVSIAFVAGARWHVRPVGRGIRIVGCHVVGLVGRGKVHCNARHVGDVP